MFGKQKDKLFFEDGIIYKEHIKDYRESVKTDKRVQKAIVFQFNIHKIHK